MRALGIALACTGIFASAPCNAQVSSWGSKTAAGQVVGCELHIFPANPPQVVDATQSPFTGLVPLLLNDMFALKDPAAIQRFIASSVPLSTQLEILRSIDYSRTVRGRERTIVIHDVPFAGLTLKEFKTRVRVEPASSAQCYEELVLTVQYYEKSTMASSVKNAFFYRRFSTESAPIYVEFGGFGRSVPKFPPEKEDQIAPAVEALRAVYRENILKMLNRF